tara:strand:- start:11365 stop:12225 length:861 start_codon:yes stop_codon:yes gene_type:complete
MKKISIITSLYKAEKYLKGFLENIVQQTIFDDCELFLLDGNSPENEYDIIKPFLSYDNIRYERLEEDPGIYGCWNYMIENSDSQYITNANVDDKMFNDSIERHVNILDRFSIFDVSYCLNAVSHSHSDSEDLAYVRMKNSKNQKVFPTAAFSKRNMLYTNLPHNHPVWRRSIHNDCGMFDTENYISGSDYDFWLRASIGFDKKFILIPEILGIYYDNPEGMSTKKANLDRNMEEFKVISKKYHLMYHEGDITKLKERSLEERVSNWNRFHEGSDDDYWHVGRKPSV